VLFRSHSIEVASIARRIAAHLNEKHALGLDLDVCEFAGLCHDLGHPPFGHTGEHVLNRLMRDRVGASFEGNAQTLRLVATLEERELQESVINDRVFEDIGGGRLTDHRVGLNITFRSLASVLKYPREIPAKVDGTVVHKGYYHYDASLVSEIGKRVFGGGALTRSVECSVMDIADDIAYTYSDLEDAFYSGYVDALDLQNPRDSVVESVAQELSQSPKHVQDHLSAFLRRGARWIQPRFDATNVFAAVPEFKRIAVDPRVRSQFFDSCIANAISTVCVQGQGVTTRVDLGQDVFEEVQVLKRYLFNHFTMSPKMQVAAARCEHMLEHVFDSMLARKGSMLPQRDQSYLIAARHQFGPSSEQFREIEARLSCDFLANLTDAELVDLFRRLSTGGPTTLHSYHF
jgi:dGTPase